MPTSSKTPAINDVARLSGVSKKTVSRAINRSALLSDDTRTKAEAVIAELGYVPNPQARALALRRNFLLGLLHDDPNAQTVLKRIMPDDPASEAFRFPARLVKGQSVGPPRN
jgi:LacI family transcriptional regulator